MGEWIGRGRKARRCYGFDEIALIPGLVTINPDEVDISWTLGPYKFECPILAAAMDGVVDPRFASLMGQMGGLGVLNLEGIYTRYKNPYEVIGKIISASTEESTTSIQSVYQEPVKEELIETCIKKIKAAGAPAIVSVIPQRAAALGPLVQEAGADIFVVQSTVTTVRHISSQYEILDFAKLKKELKMPIVVGNCVTYEATLELMETGIDGILIGVGPGAACTTRGVLGIGIPQVTATIDAASARDFHYKQSGKYVPIITDGGMSTGGNVCKAFACGADAVMIGSAFARATESPGQGHHWGMATSHANLPRGTLIKVGTTGTLRQILHGPAIMDDGSQNLIGALRTSMGSCGAASLREMQLANIIIAPAIKTEGKIFQQQQHVGMGSH